LLVGLTNKYNVWASTLDKADVDVMQDRIENGANLLKEHCFQFDFLNDEFTPVSKGGKLPDKLFEIINDEKRREKLLVYINPPYAEARGEQIGKSNKKGFHLSTVHDKYINKIGKAVIEMFAQFSVRIYSDLPKAKLAMFSKLKYITSPNFDKFRDVFRATYKKGFIVPANTFDNVDGEFPVGFLIWDLDTKKTFKKIRADIFNKAGCFNGTKTFYCPEKKTLLINDWASVFPKDGNSIATVIGPAADFQHQSTIWILGANSNSNWFHWQSTQNNLIPTCVYFAVRHCIPADWINDRDQFLYPNNQWKKDEEFQNNCFAYTLFHGQNNISIKEGVNHWIPFSENEVNAREKFDSHFMLSFIGGKIIPNGYSDLFEQGGNEWCEKREFSPEANAVFDAGRELWRYYHSQKDANPNAAFYDIREYFQGRNAQGRMNSKSDNEKYNFLIGDLREKMKILAKKIEPKVYEYGFLMR